MATTVLENVCKVFPPNVKAVDRISLDIPDGQFMVLVGPSGCGKSTVLRMIAGLETPTSGRIIIGGRDVTRVEPKDRDIAMVFQDYALYPHMTVAENMAFGLKMRRRPQKEINARVREAAEMLDLTGLLDPLPKQLSGGQRQRVAVGRAIVRKPAAFLFDEPLSNLDARLRVEMRAELKRLHSRLRTTSIYVTHDQVEAMTLGDRVAVMRDGVLQQVGTPLEIYDCPVNRFVAGFLGSPPMNFMEGRLEAGDGGLVFALDDIRFPLNPRVARSPGARAGQRALLGVRPENVRVGESGSPREAGLEARVEVVEPLGDETVLYVRVAGQTLIGKADPHRRIAVNDAVPVSLDPQRLLYFDLETGANLATDERHGEE